MMETHGISARLYARVRQHLGRTWPQELDPDGGQGLYDSIARGMKRLNGIGGAELDFETPGEAQELLFNYLLYDASAQLHQFFENYRMQLRNLAIRKEVRQYVAEREQADSEL